MTPAVIIILIFIVIVVIASVGPRSHSNTVSNNKFPDPNSISYAHRYFGKEWKAWLKTNATNFALPEHFYETIALALEALSPEEQKHLLLSFLKVSSNGETPNSNELRFQVGLNDYEDLHGSTFVLLQASEFSIPNMINLLKDLAERKKARRAKLMKTDNIIDVTGHSHQIESDKTQDIPNWEHRYVYSYSELSNATPEQQAFYQLYKTDFLKGKYRDLKGNSNYCFILLFDLLNEYEIHRDVLKVEQQLENLSYNYPVTRPYTRNFLIRKVRELSDNNGMNLLQQQGTNNTSYFVDDYRLGKQYFNRLKLSKEEASFLNKFPNPTNVFLSIEGCCIETISLYLKVLKELEIRLTQKDSSIKKEVSFFQKEIVKLYQTDNSSYWGGYDNSYIKERVESEVFLSIFKRAENTVRTAWGHKRKISGDFPYNQTITQEFENRIGKETNKIIDDLLSIISVPDTATEIELNTQNVNRWKIRFEQLEKDFSEINNQDFISGVLSLEISNQKNPSIENIFFEASKFIAKFDRVWALKFYIYYLYYDLKSSKFDNKQLTKTIQKNLFKTNEQLNDFGKVVADLIKSRDLKIALDKVADIYEPKRKKIRLDLSAIKEVQEEDHGTVQLLNEYLKDEFEDENTTIKAQEINMEEIKLEIESKHDSITNSPYLNGIFLNEIQTNAISLFINNSFSVPIADMDNFCKSRGILKNQLVESINDVCYETLDDILIEETDNLYQINQAYYNKIITL